MSAAPDLLAALVEGAPDSVFVADAEGRVRHANSALAELLGRPMEAIVGCDAALLFPDAAVGEERSAVVRRDDGFAVPVVIRLTRAAFDGHDVLVGRVARAGACRIPSDLEELLALSEDLLWVARRDGLIVRASASSETVLGYRREELEGHPFLDRIHPDDVAPTLAVIEGARESGRVAHFRNRYRARDGSWRWLEWSARMSPERDLAFAVGRDVTRTVELEEERERLLLAQARFVPKAFLDVLGKGNIADVRPGESVQRDIAVLFADVRAFATLSERMTARQTFDFVNSYLELAGPIIRSHGGIVDKYIGDAVMGLFPDGPESALRAAVDLQTRVRAAAATTPAGRPVIDIGIGVHAGVAILGFVGEPERLQATVISDAVNVCARLERLTRTYDAGIVVSEQVLLATPDPEAFGHRFLGRTRVSGKSERVATYDVFDADPPELRCAKERTRPAFERAVRLLGEGQRAAARAQLAALGGEVPDDGTVRRMLEMAERGVGPWRELGEAHADR